VFIVTVIILSTKPQPWKLIVNIYFENVYFGQ